MDPIVTLAELAPWVGKTEEELEGDLLATAVLFQASNLARHHGREPDWTAGGETAAPQIVKDKVIQLAARVYNNPRAIEQRQAGPISERLVAELVTGMAFTPLEIETINEVRANGGGGGLWIQPLMTGRVENANDGRPTWSLPMQLGPGGLITPSGIQPWRYPGEEG